MKIFQKVYFSNSTDLFDENFDIPNILEKSIKNNNENNISGLLLYHSGCFLQLLEGKEKDVENTFDRISQDKRHQNLITIIKTSCNERIFKNWSMDYKKLSRLEIEQVDKIIKWSSLINDPTSVSNEQINQLFQLFAE